MQKVLATQPESKGQQLLRGFRFYKAVFPKIILLALVLSFITFIPQIIILWHGQNNMLAEPPFSPTRLFFILLDLLGLVILTAMLERIFRLIAQKHGTLLTDCLIAVKKLPLILIAVIIQMAFVFFVNIVFFGLVIHYKTLALLAFPWGIISIGLGLTIPLLFIIFIFILFYFYLPLIVVENKGIIASLTKSATLVWGNWWRTFLIQLLPWLIYLILLLILKYSLNLPLHIYFLDPNLPATGWGTILHIIIFALFIPWMVSVMLVQLRDLELRKKIVNPRV